MVAVQTRPGAAGFWSRHVGAREATGHDVPATASAPPSRRQAEPAAGAETQKGASWGSGARISRGINHGTEPAVTRRGKRQADYRFGERMRHPLVLGTVLAVLASPLQAQAPARMMGAPYHDPSRAFIDLMIPHHETAIMMSEHHLQMSRNDAVKALARRMIADQRQEIAELKATRRALFGSDSSRSPMARAMTQMMGMDRMRDTAARRSMMDSMHQHQPPVAGAEHPGMHREGMMGMMPGDMDRMFLEHMIAHHRDGIDMALLAEDSQAAARVKQLARKSREGQERDIGEMRRVLGSLPRSGGEGR